MKWRYFPFSRIYEALDWAHEGNVAVHHTGFPYKHYSFTAHLLCKNIDELEIVRKELGLRKDWLQVKRPSNSFPDREMTHYDIFGTYLTKALDKCDNDPRKLEGGIPDL